MIIAPDILRQVEGQPLPPDSSFGRQTPLQIERFGHPAVCPVEIPYRSIQAYTGSGASIFEPFGGSGTTLIAAEKVSRRAYVMEISPTYCDVIVKRWETLTGARAVRVIG